MNWPWANNKKRRAVHRPPWKQIAHTEKAMHELTTKRAVDLQRKVDFYESLPHYGPMLVGLWDALVDAERASKPQNAGPSLPFPSPTKVPIDCAQKHNGGGI